MDIRYNSISLDHDVSHHQDKNLFEHKPHENYRDFDYSNPNFKRDSNIIREYLAQLFAI